MQANIVQTHAGKYMQARLGIDPPGCGIQERGCSPDALQCASGGHTALAQSGNQGNRAGSSAAFGLWLAASLSTAQMPEWK